MRHVLLLEAIVGGVAVLLGLVAVLALAVRGIVQEIRRPPEKLTERSGQ